MKQLIILLLIICIPCLALAEPVTLGEPLTGTLTWPENSGETDAVYLYRYSFPTAADHSTMAEGINAFFQDYLEDAAAFTVPIHGESIENPEKQSSTVISGTVTCNTDNAFSILVTSHSTLDGYVYDGYAGYVFARSGPKEGLVISLPYLLGILDADVTDTWLQDRQTAKVDKCVRDLLWEQIEENREGRNYYSDNSYDLFEDMFYPEEDFYLDEAGNPVFFVQPGILAPEEEGVLLFPVSFETILDEI
ncbi:MAG: hypothetical protein K6A68_14290 [Clostridiales bacterium]|nr:hypothetical protein [Clostridiales bacterium]